jgi:ribose/xylose/arabinose/galactoside ABC-type transport system permease subunit
LAEAPWLLISMVLVVIMLFRLIALLGDGFTPAQLFKSTVPSIVIMGFLVIPMIIIVAAGDADLSSGALAGLVSCIVAAISPEAGLGSGIVISFLIALGVGLINGVLVGLGKLKGIIVTFVIASLFSSAILVVTDGRTIAAPEELTHALTQSPLIICLWLLLAAVSSALMIFTPLGRRPKAGDPEQEPLGLRLLYRGLPFVFSSLMAWIAGILLLSWIGYGTIAAGAGYTEIALLATLLGGTAYYGGTGFVFSGVFALISIVLFQQANQVIGITVGNQRVITGMLLLVMLPITHYYHIGVDWLYRQQATKTVDVSDKDGSSTNQ